MIRRPERVPRKAAHEIRDRFPRQDPQARAFPGIVFVNRLVVDNGTQAGNQGVVVAMGRGG
jgi:hypothetical protein